MRLNHINKIWKKKVQKHANFSFALNPFDFGLISKMFTVKPFESTYGDKIDNILGVKHALYEYNPGKLLFPCGYQSIAEKVLDLPVREDDIWLVSFPRTGSTWCQEMIWLMGNNLDFEKSRSSLQFFRAPLLEASVVLDQYAEVLKEKFTDSVDYVNNLPSPRFIKTHITYPLLPTQINKVKPKIIYVMRNPKDQCVSYYHYTKLAYGFDISFEEYCELFLNGGIACGDIFNHYMEFWKRRHEKNILILKYEDIKRDTRKTLKKLAEFMGKSFSDEDLTSLEDFLTFEKMKDYKGCNFSALIDYKRGKDYYEKSGEHFIRKGEVGDWKHYMSPEMSERFDEWIEKNTKGTGLSF